VTTRSCAAAANIRRAGSSSRSGTPPRRDLRAGGVGMGGMATMTLNRLTFDGKSGAAVATCAAYVPQGSSP
jgi:hypothetical protein